MKQALCRGGPAALNVHSVGKISRGDFLGYAAFPWDYRQNPGLDGVMIDFGALPGGTYAEVNTGRILVHEVGRKCLTIPSSCMCNDVISWLGNVHIFRLGWSVTYVPGRL